MSRLATSRPPGTSGRAPWIALLTLAVLVLGIVVAVSQWRRPGVATAPSVARVEIPVDTSEAVIREAIAQASDDSTALKRGWVDDIRGLDVSKLEPGEVATLVRFANAVSCTCGCGFTLAACRAWDLTCPVSLPLVEAMRDSILAAR